MTTIREVAKASGVSVATVSRVLNDNGYVDNVTKQHVNQVIEQLHYKPNAVARSLYKKSSQSIGLIIPDITNPFFPELARAVEDVMNKAGFTVILGNSDELKDKEREYIDMMKQKYVDGMICVSNTLDQDQIETFEKPVVAIDRRPEHSNVPAVVLDNVAGAREAVSHLFDIGCQKVAHVKGPNYVKNATDRYEGYLDIVSHKVWFNEDYVIEGDYNDRDTYTEVLSLLRDYPDIDGIFAGNDLMAIGTLKACETLGIQVPGDLAIIGFDGIGMGEVTTPGLSTMAQPIYKIGKTAGDMLMALMKGETLEKSYYELSTQLVKRQST